MSRAFWVGVAKGEIALSILCINVALSLTLPVLETNAPLKHRSRQCFRMNWICFWGRSLGVQGLYMDTDMWWIMTSRSGKMSHWKFSV